MLGLYMTNMQTFTCGAN